MTNVIYIIPAQKRQAFDEQWEQILPEGFKKGHDYTATWYSESPFPYFNNAFLKSLPTDYGEKLKDLYKTTILD